MAESDAEASAPQTTRGRQAEQPLAMPKRGWLDILWRVWQRINEDRLFAVSAGVAFFVLLSIFPMLTAFVSLYGLVADPTTVEQHLDALAGVLPQSVVDTLAGQLRALASQQKEALSLGFALGLSIALWSANSGTKALFDALNVAYHEKEKRGFIKLNLLSLTFTLGGILFLIVAVSSVIVVPAVLAILGLGSFAALVTDLVRWPLLLVAATLTIGVLYHFGPSRERAKPRWLSLGSILATLLWVGASALFSWYVANFANYDKTYGSLGAAVGFMMWIWLSVTIVLLCAELNAEIEHQTTVDSTTGPPQPMGKRGTVMADTLGQSRKG